ncbi:MAG: hypothetical protein RLZZ60_1024 [Bacteroidota bacterium]|jgi:hypothetical protein
MNKYRISDWVFKFVFDKSYRFTIFEIYNLRPMIKRLTILILLVFSATAIKAEWRELIGAKTNFNGTIKTTCSDSTGSIFAAGAFKNSNGKYYVAKWDGLQWQELGGDNALKANGVIFSICSDAKGNIYAAGKFTNANGKCYVAKWDGNNWSELSGTNSLAANDTIRCLFIDKKGFLYAAGNFTNSSFDQYVAVWNGSVWNQLGGTDAWGRNNVIKSICADDSGFIYAAGGGVYGSQFYTPFVAKWNGSKWNNFISTNNNLNLNSSSVECVLSDANSIYICGTLSDDLSKNLCVLKWSNNTWSELGNTNTNETDNFIMGICKDRAGNIYAGFYQKKLMKWNGSNWTSLKENDLRDVSGGLSTSLIIDKNDHVILGSEDGNGFDVFKWNGNNWILINGLNALNARVRGICSDNNGNVYASGDFYFRNSQKNVFKWNGVSWNELGGIGGMGINKANGTIVNIASDNNNNVYAVGAGTNNYGRNYVAKWDGNAWGELKDSNTINKSQSALFVDNTNNVYTISMHANIRTFAAKWNGSQWYDLGAPISNTFLLQVANICKDNVGNIYAVGSFKNDSNYCYVAKWDGSNWTELGGFNALKANNNIWSITTDGKGNIYVGGGFKNKDGYYYVAKWDGNNWAELGGNNGIKANGFIYTICCDQLGNIYAAGNFKNSSGFAYVAVWNGSNWSELGGVNALSANNDIFQIHIDKNSVLYAGGAFNNKFHYLAQYKVCNKSITQQPINQGLYSGNAIFTCATDDSNASFQWQINGGSGWNNLTNVGQYSGANNDTLLVSNVITFNNNQRFRCIINGSCLTDTTEEAKLSVWGVGIDDVRLADFELYPNPSNSSVTINYSRAAYNISICNSVGQMVLSQNNLINEQTLDVNQWSKGVYYITLKTENSDEILVKKWVKL